MDDDPVGVEARTVIFTDQDYEFEDIDSEGKDDLENVAEEDIEDGEIQPQGKRKDTMETWENLSSLFTQLQGKMDDKRSTTQLVNRNKVLSERIVELEGVVEKLKAEVEAANELKQKNKELEEKCAECMRKHDEVRAAEDNLRSAVDRIGEVLNLQSRLTEADVQRKYLESQIEDLTQRLDGQTASLAGKQIELLQLRSANAKLKKKATEYHTLLQQGGGRSNGDDMPGMWEMKELQKLNAQLNDENGSLRLTIEDLESKVEDFQGIIATLEGRYQETKKENEDLQVTFDELASQKLDYQEDVDNFQSSLKSLQKQLAKILDDNEKKEEVIDQLLLISPCIITLNDSIPKVNGSYQLKEKLLNGRPHYKKHHEDTTLLWDVDKNAWIIKNGFRITAMLEVDVLHPLLAPSDAPWSVFSKGDYVYDPKIRLVNAGEILCISEDVQAEQLSFTQKLFGSSSSTRKRNKSQIVDLVNQNEFWKRSKLSEEADSQSMQSYNSM